MKTKLFTFIVLFAVGFLFSSAKPAKEEFKVIKVIGEILYQNSGKKMATGDVFATGTKLNFVTGNSRAAVISSAKGRFVLAPPSKKKTTNLVPAVNSISSRSGAIVNALDFAKHFEGDYLILNRVAVPVSPQKFPQNQDNFFFVSYTYEDEKIMKQLPVGDGKLILHRDHIFMIDGQPITPFNTKINLYYRNAETKENQSLASFYAVFPNQQLLKKEIQVILDEYQSFSKEKQYQQIKGYLNEFYGKPFDANLKSWLDW
ncbi:hypothetical protein CW751_09435 [Brumimicrobium salinarum]|uniref:Plasminogen-binding protein PgbA N-terminal domain-containing protein n=1 Tax=Brumimicrobium salinarum TaxID=2058658 RepID=A0A2I0R1Y9_9FLAO|nr:hypothetical protein [Brumimicrobium salinarum]PKR80586.1 hypothetical protein CW751_09435 [Brumimicrobium salinarum]